MGQNSAIKNVFSRFKRGSTAKTPGSKPVASPSKLDTNGASPTKRLFAFSPAKPPLSARKGSSVQRPLSKEEDLIPAGRSGITSPGILRSQPGDSAGDDSNIKVVVRVRPRNEREASMGGAICVQPMDSNGVRLVPPAEAHSFGFDFVASETATQQDIFEVAGRPIVENCLRGFNGCLFAYGQTGSGKTYSMLGGEQVGEAAMLADERRGLIQRIFEHIFAAAEDQATAGVQTTIKCSFLEIYNETISDLLSPGATSGLALREDIRKGGGVYVENLTEDRVINVQDVAELLQVGIANRRVGETLMNERSSRSHSVFTATVERRTPGVNGAPDSILRSRLHLVDLAGSERQKTTGAAGERLREASSINKSLSTLGLVIMSLVDQQQGRQRHIPYRDSKLTTLLKDSLGGNAKTVMVACVSPAAVNAAETLGTLRFADSAKRIKNKAVVNEDAEGDAESLRQELKRLKQELALMKQQNGGAASNQDADPLTPVRGMAGAAAEGVALPTTCGAGGEGVRRALISALRREEEAATKVSHLEEELEGMRGLVAAKEADLQRTAMMLKLKESRLARTALPVDDVVTSLTSEIELLKAKLESHPEVKKFAVENLHLSHEVARLQGAVDKKELSLLMDDVASLRREILDLAEKAEIAEEDAARARAQADTAAALLERDRTALQEVQNKLREQEAAPELQVKIEMLEKENDELKLAAVDAAALKEESERLCAHAGGLESQCAELKGQLECKAQEYLELNASNDQNLGKVQELSLQLEEARKLSSEKETALDGAQQELAKMQQEHETALKGANSALEASISEVESLKAELEKSRALVQELEAAVESAAEERDGVVEELVRKEQELRECTEKLSNATKELTIKDEKLADAEKLASELAAVKARAEEAEGAVNKATEQIQEIEDSLNRTKEALEAATADVEGKKEQIAALEAAAVQATADLEAKKTALDTATAEANKLRSAMLKALDQHREDTEKLQEELRELESSKDEMAFELSDKSASLTEAKEQLISLRAALKIAKESEEKASAKIAELNGQVQAGKQALEVEASERQAFQQQVALLEEEVREARAEVQTARCGPLEKEQQLLQARAELAETKARLERREREASKLAVGMKKKEEEVARVRAEMAAEVNEAAQQVQELLAAQARAEAAEERAAELARKLRPPSLGAA